MPGQWEPLIPRFPAQSYPDPGFQAIHMIHLYTGKLLVIDFNSAILYDPSNGAWEPVIGTPELIFCSGHSQLADGRIFFAGGNYVNQKAPKIAYIFDPMQPSGSQWIPCPNMTYARYYPTCTTMPDGKILVMSGRQSDAINTEAQIPELFTPSGATGSWTPLPNLTRQNAMYSFLHVLPDGKLFLGGPWLSPGNRIIDTTTNPDPPQWQWAQEVETPMPPQPQATPLPPAQPPYNPVGVGLSHGSCVMYRPGKLLKAGGSSIDSDPGIRGAAIVDLNNTISPPESWTLTADPTVKPAYSRAHLNLVVLPDGKVLCVGGLTYVEHYRATTCSNPNTNPQAQFQAEIWDQGAGGAWSNVGDPMANPRYYHSVAILLRDATVLVAGGNRDCGLNSPYPYTVNSAQVFKPPYLDNNPIRPVITTAPTTIPYGPFTLDVYYEPTLPPLMEVGGALVRPGAVTHSYDMDQRYIALPTRQLVPTPGLARFNLNLNANVAPPGYYMLFLLASDPQPAAPCTEARYVRVG